MKFQQDYVKCEDICVSSHACGRAGMSMYRKHQIGITKCLLISHIFINQNFQMNNYR